jgi:hypothetical protein
MQRFVAMVSAMLVALAGLTEPAAPAAAQQAWNLRTITVFGNDRCPPDTICVRAPESERYRIPKDLRGDTGLALAERWGDRARSLEYVGQSGTMSCSPVGAGGATGCFRQLAEQARAERRARGEDPGIKIP